MKTLHQATKSKEPNETIIRCKSYDVSLSKKQGTYRLLKHTGALWGCPNKCQKQWLTKWVTKEVPTKILNQLTKNFIQPI